MPHMPQLIFVLADGEDYGNAIFDLQQDLHLSVSSDDELGNSVPLPSGASPLRMGKC